ncbi:hypothetical protein [Vibrio mediterranei]|uniref:hypothetical protein n=1 Tax=Vibrio mediterranei TaxID=689 RepID=UPI0040698637
MSRVHLSISLNPHEPNERLLLKCLYDRYKAAESGELSKLEMESQVKHLLMSGLYLETVESGLACRLSHHLAEPDLVPFLQQCLGNELSVRDAAVPVAIASHKVDRLSSSLPARQSTSKPVHHSENNAETSAPSISVGEMNIEEPDLSLDNGDAMARIKKSGFF